MAAIPLSSQSNGGYSHFERQVLRMAWEGCWYALFELPWLLRDALLPGVDLHLCETDLRNYSLDAVSKLIDDGLVALCRFDYETCERVLSPDLSTVLSDDETWVSQDITSQHIRFEATDAGMRAFEALPAKLRRPLRRRRLRVEPELHWAERHVQRYLVRATNLYDLYRPMPLISDFYDALPDTPDDRLGYFWNQVIPFCRTVLRLTPPGAEPQLRDYLEQWRAALGLSEEAWLSRVRREGKPLTYLNR
jgi:hypothetical protein